MRSAPPPCSSGSSASSRTAPTGSPPPRSAWARPGPAWATRVGLGLTGAGLVYGVWLVGIAVPVVGGLAQRLGPQRLLPGLVAMSLVGCLLTLVDSLPVVVAGLGLMALAMFSTVTTCPLLLPRLVGHDPGAPTSLPLTLYYLGGALGAYLPGLWLDAGWSRLVAVCAPSTGCGRVAALALRAAPAARSMPA